MNIKKIPIFMTRATQKVISTEAHRQHYNVAEGDSKEGVSRGSITEITGGSRDTWGVANKVTRKKRAKVPFTRIMIQL